MRWKALAEIYTMHSFAPFSKLNFVEKSLKNLPEFQRFKNKIVIFENGAKECIV